TWPSSSSVRKCLYSVARPMPLPVLGFFTTLQISAAGMPAAAQTFTSERCSSVALKPPPGGLPRERLCSGCCFVAASGAGFGEGVEGFLFRAMDGLLPGELLPAADLYVDVARIQLGHVGRA